MGRPALRKKAPLPRLKKWLSKLLGAVLALLLSVIFYVAVVMGQPSAQVMEIAQGPQAQSPLEAQPAYQTRSQSQMVELLGQFPAPALTFSDAAGLAFVSGRAYDMAFEGGFARLLELIYITPMGREVTLQSIYPARAYELLGRENYTLETLSQGALGGQNAVIMRSNQGIRLHAQGEEALYALSVPLIQDEELLELTRHTLLVHPS